MNRTNVEHLLYMWVFQVVALVVAFVMVWPLVLAACVGFAFGVGVYSHREYAQAEEKARQITGKSKHQLQLWDVVRFISRDGVLDWVFPVVGGIGFCFAIVYGLEVGWL